MMDLEEITIFVSDEAHKHQQPWKKVKLSISLLMTLSELESHVFDVWSNVQQSCYQTNNNIQGTCLVIHDKIIDSSMYGGQSVFDMDISSGSELYVMSNAKSSIRYVLKLATTSDEDRQQHEICIPSYGIPIWILKIFASQRFSIPRENIRFIFAGKTLENHRRPLDYCLGNGSTIHVLMAGITNRRDG
mmetsp:Transcript_8722/g.13623  ORF Transcript_8722/g.13623 Transcript_8722/m.13623 type:complete len:189 (+) Transcript_8722:86-652(+)